MFGKSMAKNSFADSMNEKINQYNALIMRAERINYENQGRPTKEEGMLYAEAMDVCSEIMNMNLSQKNTYSKWIRQKMNCESEVQRILKVLDPRPEPTPAPKAEAPVTPEPAPAQPVSPAPAPKAAASKAAPASGTPQNSTAAGKTASVFATRNATKDVPAEVIESWYMPLPKISFDDLVGMEPLREQLEKKISLYKYHLLQEHLGLEKLQTFVFYGPPGTGKSTVVEAFARELMEHENYKFLRLSGDEIKDQLVSLAEKRVAALCKEAVDCAPCIVFVDELENVCANRKNPNVAEHQKSLTVAFLEGYNRLKEANVPVVFIGATNLPENIDAAMLDRVALIEIGLPGPEMRQKFFEKKLAKVHLEEGLTAETFAAETENYSFRDLQELIQSVLAEFGDRTIRENRRQTPDGKEDVAATDSASAAAIAEGKAVLTRELFDQIKAKQKLKTELNKKH